MGVQTASWLIAMDGVLSAWCLLGTVWDWETVLVANLKGLDGFWRCMCSIVEVSVFPRVTFVSLFVGVL